MDIKNITINKDFIICSNNGIFITRNLMSNIVQPVYIKIYNKLYIGGINIDDNYCAFTSNRILLNGEDKIIFYNSNTKKIIQIEEFSFILSRNNLSIIPIPDKYNKTKKDKLLFCACKKYLKTQKNGILLLKLKIELNLKIYKKFYNTGNFEVYCFCNIFKIDHINIFENKKKKRK